MGLFAFTLFSSSKYKSCQGSLSDLGFNPYEGAQYTNKEKKDTVAAGRPIWLQTKDNSPTLISLDEARASEREH